MDCLSCLVVYNHGGVRSGRSDPSHGIFLDDKAKPSVSYRPTALLFEQGAQYKISKIKFAISVMAVTPATESTKASLAPW